MVIPFVGKVANVGYRYVNAFVFRALYKSRKAVMISTDVYKLPVVISAHCFQEIYVFGLKRFVVIACITAGRKLITYALNKIIKFKNFDIPTIFAFEKACKKYLNML